MTCSEWWPIPPSDVIGEERARELVEYMRHTAPPVIQIAKDHLQERHLGQRIRTRAMNVQQLAAQPVLDPRMIGLDRGRPRSLHQVRL